MLRLYSRCSRWKKSIIFALRYSRIRYSRLDCIEGLVYLVSKYISIVSYSQILVTVNSTVFKMFSQWSHYQNVFCSTNTVDYFWYSSTILYYTILVFSFLSLIVVEQWSSQLLLSSTAVEREVPLGTSAVVSYYSACEESPETFMTTSELQYRVSKQVLNNHIPKLIKSSCEIGPNGRSSEASFRIVLESRQSNSKAH